MIPVSVDRQEWCTRVFYWIVAQILVFLVPWARLYFELKKWNVEEKGYLLYTRKSFQLGLANFIFHYTLSVLKLSHPLSYVSANISVEWTYQKMMPGRYLIGIQKPEDSFLGCTEWVHLQKYHTQNEEGEEPQIARTIMMAVIRAMLLRDLGKPRTQYMVGTKQQKKKRKWNESRISSGHCLSPFPRWAVVGEATVARPHLPR